MNQDRQKVILEDSWQFLKKYTHARIALGRCGSSVPTHELLRFQLSHAQAIDAVHLPLNKEKLLQELGTLTNNAILHLHSAAKDRSEYLRRPDLGRILSDRSSELLKQHKTAESYDISIVVADGLSATAIEKNAFGVLKLIIPELEKAGYTLSPLAIVEQGRVAVADEVAVLFPAKMVVVLIGERPGLKSPDSMGIYMTYNPGKGTTDEKRNCISNIRKEGLSYAVASSRLLYLMEESFRRKLSGVDLKDEQPELQITQKENMQYFKKPKY